MPEDIIDPEVEQRGTLAPVPTQAPVAPQSPTGTPKLNPVQMQFIQALSGAPQDTVPFGGASFQGVSAPGYAAAYQPAQAFNDPAYQKSLYEWEQEVRRTAEAARAEQAIQAGIRYIYQRQYDEALKKGVPEPQAFSKMMLGIAMHTPKMDPVKTFNAFRPPTTTTLPGIGPVVYGQRVQFPPTPIPTGPVETEPLIGTDNKPIPGLRVARGKSGALHIVKEAPAEAKAPLSLQYRELRDKIQAAEKQLVELPGAGKKSETPETKKQREALQAKIDGWTAEREALTHPKAATAPIDTTGLPTATNPATGEKMVYKDGKWQLLK